MRLRLIRESDLERLHDALSDLANRGRYFPIGLMSETTLRSQFDDNGFWGEDEGMLLIVDHDDRLVGEIEFYPITHYLQGYELSYLLFGSEHAGRGYTTEALGLLVEYLFARKRVNRMQLNIHPDNAPSRRVAEKAGFTYEGLMRGCWFHHGDYDDLEIWSLLRAEL